MPIGDRDLDGIIDVENSRLLSTYRKFGVVAVKGKGSYLWDAGGRRFLDFMGGYGVAIVGHSRREVIDAIEDQAERLIICHNTLYNPTRAKFLEELFKVVPRNMSAAYMANSGAEAIEAAIKIAVKATGRSLFVAAKGSYHGKTIGALSLTWGPRYKEHFSKLLLDVHFVEYGDPKSLEDAPLEDAAAIFLEPVQGEAGVRIPTREFMTSAERRCRKAGCLLVIDEIQSGLGRTGRMWAHEHWGISPDVMTIGKGIAGGIPMGVTVVSSDYADVLRLGEHTSTFGGNPLASAAAAAVLRVIEEEDLARNAERMGHRFSRGLEGLEGRFRIPREHRGLGLMAALDMRLRIQEVIPRMISNGLISTYSGLRTLRFLPPLIVDEDDIDTSISILDTTFGAIEREKRSM